MAPQPIREVKRKLRAFDCDCLHHDASRYRVQPGPQSGAPPFYIEVSHGKHTKANEVSARYIKKIWLKLGIRQVDWDAA